MTLSIIQYVNVRMSNNVNFILPCVIKNFVFEEVIWRNQLDKVQFDSSYINMWSSLLNIFKVSFMIKKKKFWIIYY